MNVSLTKELEEFVRRRVATGRYHSASEVVREGLRLLESREEVRSLQMEDLRRRLAGAPGTIGDPVVDSGPDRIAPAVEAPKLRETHLRWRAAREPEAESAVSGGVA